MVPDGFDVMCLMRFLYCSFDNSNKDKVEKRIETKQRLALVHGQPPDIWLGHEMDSIASTSSPGQAISRRWRPREGRRLLGSDWASDRWFRASLPQGPKRTPQKGLTATGSMGAASRL